MAENAPLHVVLWRQARDENPDNREGRKRRYVDLMREHGLLVDRQPDDDPNLPCGWPGKGQDQSE